MRDHHRGHSFASVLGRIFILLAIIAGVPVMMWIITAFMRTYVAQPVIPGPQRLSPAFAGAPPTATADMGTAGSAPSTAQFAGTRANATDTQDASGGGRSDRFGDNGNNNALPPAAFANTAVAALTRAAAPPAAGAVPGTAPLLQPDNGAMPILPSAPPPAYAPAPAPDYTSTLASRHGPVIEPPTPADLAANEELPPPHPLRGPVPLPPKRPNIIASAAAPAAAVPAAPTASGAVPLPRSRPTAAPPVATAPELPPSNYDSAGMTHY